MSSWRIILGSSSPRRKKLLAEAGIEFTAIPPDIDEYRYNFGPIRDRVKKISLQKVNSILRMINTPAIVIAADTMVWFKDKVLGKPCTKSEAMKILQDLSGNVCSVYTGVCVANKQETHTGVEKTDVSFKTLSSKDIRAYVQNNSVQSMAGGFNIARGTPGEELVNAISGSYTNAVGLPINTVRKLIEQLRTCELG